MYTMYVSFTNSAIRFLSNFENEEDSEIKFAIGSNTGKCPCIWECSQKHMYAGLHKFNSITGLRCNLYRFDTCTSTTTAQHLRLFFHFQDLNNNREPLTCIEKKKNIKIAALINSSTGADTTDL